MSPKTKFRLFLFALFAIGASLATWPWDKQPDLTTWFVSAEFWRGLAPKLGEELMVAVFLALIVDQAAKNELLREFAEDVSTHIIGRLLPLEVRQRLEKYLRAELVRRQWAIDYTITELDGEYFTLITLSDYVMENCSTSDQQYKLSYFLEDSMVPAGAATIERVTGSPHGPEVQPDEAFNYAGTDLTPYVHRRNRGQDFATVVTIRGHTTWRFTTESIEYLREGFASPYFAYQPALGTSLNVNYPEDRFEIFVDLSNGDIDTDAIKTPHLNGVKWSFKYPLLPGHGFSTRIVRKKGT